MHLDDGLAVGLQKTQLGCKYMFMIEKVNAIIKCNTIRGDVFHYTQWFRVYCKQSVKKLNNMFNV